MEIVDRGSGIPIVVIPGVQGRWEWMLPLVDTLAARARVITFSLADEPTAHAPFDPADGLGSYVAQVRDALDQASVDRAVVCGMSFGGLVAASFAAAHPDRLAALGLISALPPSWRPDARQRLYLRAPRLMLPLFCLNSLRLAREILAAYGGPLRALAPTVRHLWRVLAYPMSPRLMARRATMADHAGELPVPRAAWPVLIITGEPALDHVVPPAATAEYLRLWPGAESVTLARTGHLGHVTRPEAMADLIVRFAGRATSADSTRRHVG